MKTLVAVVVAAIAVATSAETLQQLTEEQKALLKRNYSSLTPAEREKWDAAAKLRLLVTEGGLVNYPGTPSGRILIANMQSRVPSADLSALRQTFRGLMAYDIQFSNAEGDAAVMVRIVDKPEDKESLTVWPDKGAAEVNVAALAVDNPKPAFLAARTRKEVIRAFSCATAGSTYGNALYFKLRKGVKGLDYIGNEDIPLDVIMRSSKFFEDAGVRPVQSSTYRKVLEDGYDIAPTNGYQRAIYEEVKKTTKLTRKLP